MTQTLGYVLTTIIESNIAASALFGNQSLAAFAPFRAHALALVASFASLDDGATELS